VFRAEGASQNALQTYAYVARYLGIKIMWDLSDPGWWQQPSTSSDMAGSFPSFASGCDCDQNGPLLSSIVGWLGSLPATYGYYAADDMALAAGDRRVIAAFVDQIKAQDPNRPVMISSADQDQTTAYEGIADLIGAEIYPITTESSRPATATSTRGMRPLRRPLTRSARQPTRGRPRPSSSTRFHGATTSSTESRAESAHLLTAPSTVMHESTTPHLPPAISGRAGGASHAQSLAGSRH
jgi:hypothetical protein